METIQLSKKKIVEININGVECIAVFDNLTIENFQKTNKKGLLKVYEDMEKAQKNGSIPITEVIQLLGSIIREKKSNKILGYQYFNQFDSMEVIKNLSPVINKVVPSNLPAPNGKKEKK